MWLIQECTLLQECYIFACCPTVENHNGSSKHECHLIGPMNANAQCQPLKE